MTTSAVTPVPTDWQCFPDEDAHGVSLGTYSVHEKFTEEFGKLADRIRAYEVKPPEIIPEINKIRDAVDPDHRFGSSDTEPEWAIADFFSAVCAEVGYAGVDRWAL